MKGFSTGIAVPKVVACRENRQGLDCRDSLRCLGPFVDCEGDAEGH